METVKVISHLKQPLRGRFNGEDYDFIPEKPTLLSLEACTFIFGLGKDNRSAELNRLGLLIPGHPELGSVEKANAMLDQITFMEGKVIFEDEEGGSELEADAEDSDDAGDEAPARSRRTGGRRPHVGPSGGTAPPQGGAANPVAT